jgi:hypothetical protein
MEFRIGPCVIRNIGPTFRCNDVMTDYNNQRKNPENEPLSTLASYRTLPLFGAPFGIYCKQEIVDDPRVYRELFPKDLGYPPMTHKAVVREGDNCPYIRIVVGDSVRVRIREKPDWIKKLKKQ